MVTKLSTILYLFALSDAQGHHHHRRFRRGHPHHFRESTGVQLQGFTEGLFDQIAMAYTADERIAEEREEEQKARALQKAKDHLTEILDQKERDQEDDKMAAMKLRMTMELDRSAREEMVRAEEKKQAAQIEEMVNNTQLPPQAIGQIFADQAVT